jgi:hypothetical protein
MSKARGAAFTATLALLALAGCVRRQTDAFPWGGALQARDAASAEVAGTYENLGAASWAPGASVHLFGVLFHQPPLAVPPADLRLRLRAQGSNQILVEALLEGRVLASRTLTVQPVPEDSRRWGAALRLENKGNSGASNLGLGWDSGSVDLRRGADGYLYAEERNSGGGLLFYVVPFYGSSTHWMRWAPARP